MAPHTGRPGGEPGRPGTIAVALRLAWRQARGGRRHLAALFACVALGVGALVAVGTLGAGLEATLALGDRLTIGETTLTVRGVVEAEPDRAASLVRLGPRLFLSPAALERARLVSFGSRVRYRALLRLPDGLTAGDTRAELARAIVDPGVRVAAYDEAQPGLGRFFSQLTAYLGLVGLARLLGRGLGVAAAVSAFIACQVPTIAALKALGAETRTLVAAYVVQTQAVALAAGLVGAGLGLAPQPVPAAAPAGLVPFALEARAQPWTIARA